MRTVSISEFYAISKEDEEVAPVEETAVEETPAAPVETPAEDTVDTSVAFDTTGGEPTELPAEDVAEVTEDLAETTAETTETVEEQAEIADVHQELSEEVPVMEAKLENPETITPQDAMLATESLKYKLKRLNIPLNNSRALAGLTAESVVHSPAEVFQIALEDEKTLLEKTGDALKRAWEWLKKQFSKIWEFVKRLFGNTKAKLRKLKEDLKGNEYKKGEVSKEETSKLFDKYTVFSYTDDKFNADRIISGNAFAMTAISEFAFKFARADDNSSKDGIMKSVIEFIQKLDQMPTPDGVKEVLNKANNKDYQYKAIGWYSANKATIIFINPNTDRDELDVKFEAIDIPKSDKDLFGGKEFTGSDAIKAIDIMLKAYENGEKFMEETNKTLQKTPIVKSEHPAGRIIFYIMNKIINRAIMGVTRDGMTCIEAGGKLAYLVGSSVLKQGKDVQPEAGSNAPQIENKKQEKK